MLRVLDLAHCRLAGRQTAMPTTQKHTPGPWNGKALPEGTWLIFGGYGTGGSNIGPSDANLYLITAAPDLLLALEKLSEKVRLAHSYGQTTADFGPDLDRSRRAIAKAKGEA